jgi:hypothetical protein
MTIQQEKQAIDGNEALIVKTSQSLGVSLEPEELTALTGLRQHTEPATHDEFKLRFQILDANYRHQNGMPVSERHVTLNGLFRAIKSA